MCPLCWLLFCGWKSSSVLPLTTVVFRCSEGLIQLMGCCNLSSREPDCLPSCYIRRCTTASTNESRSKNGGQGEWPGTGAWWQLSERALPSRKPLHKRVSLCKKLGRWLGEACLLPGLSRSHPPSSAEISLRCSAHWLTGRISSRGPECESRCRHKLHGHFSLRYGSIASPVPAWFTASRRWH